MAKLTITRSADVPEHTGTCKALLADENEQQRRNDAVEQLLQLSHAADSASGGARWNREELHERRASNQVVSMS